MSGKQKKKRPKDAPAHRPRTLIEVDEEIDLHGLAVDEALAMVDMALTRYRSRPEACIRIIHGSSSGNQNSLKGALKRNFETVWKRRIHLFRQELGNSGSSLVFLAKT